MKRFAATWTIITVLSFVPAMVLITWTPGQIDPGTLDAKILITWFWGGCIGSCLAWVAFIIHEASLDIYERYAVDR